MACKEVEIDCSCADDPNQSFLENTSGETKPVATEMFSKGIGLGHRRRNDNRTMVIYTALFGESCLRPATIEPVRESEQPS